MPALGFTKLSILFFYRRIFRGKIFEILSWTVIGITAVWAVVFGFLFIFICGTAFWIVRQPTADKQDYCRDSGRRQIGFAATDACTDLVTLVLPIPLVSAPFYLLCILTKNFRALMVSKGLAAANVDST